jgi:hypothetical protein
MKKVWQFAVLFLIVGCRGNSPTPTTPTPPPPQPTTGHIAFTNSSTLPLQVLWDNAVLTRLTPNARLAL